MPTNDVYNYTKLLNVEETITLELIKLVHKINMGGLVTETQMIFNRDVHNHNTRNANNVHLDLHRKKKTQNAITYKGAKLYNTISEETRKIKI